MTIGAVSSVTDKPGLQEVEDLFRQHHELVYRTAYSILHSAADAEDVVQSLFLRLVRRQLPPEVRTNVRGYFYRAAVNQSLDIIRARRRCELVADMETLDVPSGSADTQFAERLHRELDAALAELSPEAVQILLLRYTHNYSDKQIAAYRNGPRRISSTCRPRFPRARPRTQCASTTTIWRRDCRRCCKRCSSIVFR
jgi:RNA polymerase sigma-70 factor (ECF subfamily)